jgi:hypothetical protein
MVLREEACSAGRSPDKSVEKAISGLDKPELFVPALWRSDHIAGIDVSFSVSNASKTPVRDLVSHSCYRGRMTFEFTYSATFPHTCRLASLSKLK